MKIVESYPPNIDKIKEIFPISNDTIFTYGDTLYVPNGGDIDEALMKHEETHTKQQGDDPETWWNRYYVDKKFRLSQELEAYRNQYKYAVKHYTRQMRRELLRCISSDLSGIMYGSLVSKEEAKDLICKE